MQLLVRASDAQFEILLKKGVPDGCSLMRYNNQKAQLTADGYMDLLFNGEESSFSSIQLKPVFVNALHYLNNQLPENYIRMNAWNGFLENEFLEIAINNTPYYQKGLIVLDALKWNYQQTPDLTGMIAPRIIAMIINEAYFALGDGISTKENMDIAMKLGTNYPYGPFEWATLIGLQQIADLITVLGKQDNRYQLAPLIEKELKTNH